MDLKEIRRLNLAYLGDKVYGRDRLAPRLGYSDTNYINGIISGHTPLGTGNATKFGRALNLGDNWFNEPHQGLWTGQQSSLPENPALDSALKSLSESDLDLILALIKRLSIKPPSAQD